jgi:hypothetical protein
MPFSSGVQFGRWKQRQKALIIMKNPSKANRDVSDQTVNCVLEYYESRISTILNHLNGRPIFCYDNSS